jgi:tRNA acetyltransferase TAN1
MYSFNLLVSCPWNVHREARHEVIRLLRGIGDRNPEVGQTAAKGVLGVNTSLDSHRAVREIRECCLVDPSILRFTLKWVPIDLWTNSDLISLKEGVSKLKGMIRPGERWRITVEKRRYTAMHKLEIIKEIATLVDEKVDLRNPDKILRIEIIGKNAGISVLYPADVLSAAKPF